MIQNQYYCEQHPKNTIGGINIDKDIKFPRKVCMDCMINGKIPHESILNKDQFILRILDKANKLNINKQSKEMELKKQMLHNIDTIVEEITQIFLNIRESIEKIVQYQISEDKRWLGLISYQINPYELSMKDLNFLVDFLEENVYYEWIQKKKIVACQIIKVEKLLEKLVQNSYMINHLIDSIHLNYTQIKPLHDLEQLEGLQVIKKKMKRTVFQVQTLRNGDKVYQKNQQILKIQQKVLGQYRVQLTNNLEQLKHLQFLGQYGLQGVKIKEWNYFWKQQLVGGGAYDTKGNKDGRWKDLCDNFWDDKQVLEIGSYSNGKRIGDWTIQYNNQKIGGGSYDKQGDGLKIGKWIEISEQFQMNSQVTYNGTYSINGMKIGEWEIMYDKNGNGEYIYIGGGSYDQEGGQSKIGQWVELEEGFCNDKQVYQIGVYNFKGQKVGRWEFKYVRWGQQQYQQIGNGSYQQDGSQKKVGEWVELDKDFQNNKQVIYSGLYSIKGTKVGIWNTLYDRDGNGEYELIKNMMYSGGGSYSQEEDQKKIGIWVELDEGFYCSKYVIYKGEYNLEGMKVGRWNIEYHKQGDEKLKEMIIICVFSGGGSYDIEGGQKKIGNWVELDEGFFQNKQVTYQGRYNLEGMKIGKWDTMYCDPQGDGSYKNIGGGSYDLKGSQKKIGKWVELEEWFYYNAQIIYYGEYNLEGMKVGRWVIEYAKHMEGKQKDIGGGSYDLEGGQKKIGKWIELDEGFFKNKQVSYQGEYNLEGMKIGKWDTLYCRWEIYDYKQIGGGSYDLEGRQRKIGQWVELDEKFYYNKQVTYNGQYNLKGMKIGRWDIVYCDSYKMKQNQMTNMHASCGGSYDMEGNQKKVGNWVELDEKFTDFNKLIYTGNYSLKGMKVGIWDIFYQMDRDCKYEKMHVSGGGQYDQDGEQMKIGNWKVLDKEFGDDKQVIYHGDYNLKGVKTGLWLKIDLKNSEQLGVLNYEY